MCDTIRHRDEIKCGQVERLTEIDIFLLYSLTFCVQRMMEKLVRGRNKQKKGNHTVLMCWADAEVSISPAGIAGYGSGRSLNQSYMHEIYRFPNNQIKPCVSSSRKMSLKHLLLCNALWQVGIQCLTFSCQTL